MCHRHSGPARITFAVVAIAAELGISPDETAAALATAKPVKGRAEVLPTDGDYTILIDYSNT